MKKLILFPLLLIYFLGNGQKKQTVSIVNSGLFDAKGWDCIEQVKKTNNKEWPSGWIDIDEEGKKVKIYTSGVQKVELIADLQLTETIESGYLYHIWKVKQFYGNSSYDMYLKQQFHDNSKTRMTVFLYSGGGVSLGNYYVCKAYD